MATVLAAVAIGVAAPAVAAAPGSAAPGTGDAAARLDVLEGSVWVKGSGSGGWEETRTALAVAERDRIDVPDDSEAVLQFHGGQRLRIFGGSTVTVDTLGEEMSAFQLQSGTMRVRLPEDGFAPVRVRVRGGREIILSRPGSYRVSGEGDSGPYRAERSPAERIPEEMDSGGYGGDRDDSGPTDVGQWWGRDPLPPPMGWGGPGWWGPGWGPGWGSPWWGGPGWRGHLGWWDGRFHGGFSGGFGWRGPGWSGGIRWHP